MPITPTFKTEPMKRTLFTMVTGLLAWQAGAQNSCATAVPLMVPGNYYISQVDGSEIPEPVCATGGDMATAGEWYAYTATMDTAITVTTDLPQNNGVDTRVQVYVGSCGNLTCYAGDDDSGNGYTSMVTFNVQMGTTYYIAFDNRWTSSGFTFHVGFAGPGPEVNGFSTVYVPTNGMAYCVVDMNNDGLDDAVSVTANTITINYQNSGNGFTTTTYNTATASNTPSWSMCAGDLDGNGYNDLVYASGGLTFMMANDSGNGYTTVNQPQYIFCQRSNTVDINNDGRLDAFSCHDVAPNVYYINNGNGTWTWHQGGLGDTPDGGNYGSIWVDYNNDGLVDMFIAKCRGAGSPASIDQLWRNNGDGTFTDVAAAMNLADYQQSWSSAWADFDNDGDMDVMIGASSFTGGGHKLMRNDGTTFTNVTANSGFDMFTGTSIEFIARDFDNDGYVDVLGGGALMHNNGNMTFTQVAVPFSNGPTGDLDHNGFVDVQNGNTIYLNAGNTNHWLTVHTVGTVSNTNGIGARVELTSPLGTQIRDIRSGDGFRYMSSLNAHFGIGTDTTINSVTVRWPSGIVNTVENPPVNGLITIIEDPAGSVGIPEQTTATIGVFPSPVSNMLHIQAPLGLNGNTASVLNLAGQVVARHLILHGSIDVSGLPGGIYLLKVETKVGLQLAKFVKQ